MKKRDLLRRIEELEQRVAAVEARPQFFYTPSYPYSPTIVTPTTTPFWESPFKYNPTTITCAPPETVA